MLLTTLANEVFHGGSRRFAVPLWNGSVLDPNESPRAGTLKLNRPRALAAFLPPWSERRLAQAYVEREIDFDGSVVDLLHAASSWQGPAPRLAAALARLERVLSVGAS